MPQFIYIVILLVPAVLVAQKTAVFCVPELHSQYRPPNLETTTQLPLKFVILIPPQQELHAFITLLHVGRTIQRNGGESTSVVE